MQRAEPAPVLIGLERHTALGPTAAARLLGLPYVSYAQYRSGLRQLKRQHLNHIKAVMRLDPRALRQHIEDSTNAEQQSLS